MKSVIILASLLMSSSSFAAVKFDACSAFYASGIGHVFKGMAHQLGDKEKVAAGETTSDKLYTFSLSTEKVPTLKETKSGKSVALQVLMDEGAKVFATESLNLFPDSVPGSFAGRKFVVILCAENDAF